MADEVQEVFLATHVDWSQFRDMVRGLTGQELRRAIDKAVRKSSKLIQKGVADEIKSQWPNSGGRKKRTKAGWFTTRPIWRDVKIAVWRKSVGSTISLYSSRHPDSRAYVLRYLNSPTGERRTLSGKYRGAVGSGPNPPNFGFFERGVAKSASAAVKSLEKNVHEAIDKIANK